MVDTFHLMRAWSELFVAGQTSRGFALSSGDEALGRFGCGKTHLAVAVGHAVMARAYSFRFWYVPDLLQAMRSDFDRKQAGATLNAAATCDVLCLDDFGTERIADGERGDWSREQLGILFDRRARAGRPLILTTNCYASEIAEHVGGDCGGRMLSRLSAMAQWLSVGGPDHRTL